jgi:hypothetical protein
MSLFSRRYMRFATWPWSVVGAIALLWLGVWGILLKRELDSGIEAARALCSLPQVSSCDMTVSLSWQQVILPIVPLILILIARWIAGSRERATSGGRLTSA